MRELTSRSCGLSVGQVIARLNAYTKGWWNYFRHAEAAAGFRSINYWIRRRWVVIAMPNAYFDKLGLFLPGPRSA